MTRQLGLLSYKSGFAYEGYTLFSPLGGHKAYLIDMLGNVVHRWQLSYHPADYGYLLDNGNLLAAGKTGKSPVQFGGRGGIILEMNWGGEILWSYEDPVLHHDFCRMANGNTMVLGCELIPEDVARRVKGGRPGTEHAHGIWSDFFREVTPEGKAMWEWHSHENLDPEEEIICPVNQRREWLHTNACDVLPDGNILTSFRLLDTVAIIDKQSGRFLWKWGKDELGHQHDPSLLDNGNILIFDNGMLSVRYGASPGSRVVEVNPNTNQIEWTYETKPPWQFFSGHISGAQRLANGNTLICEGVNGRLFEVTRQGEIVWEYVNPFFNDEGQFGRVNMVFRAYRYSPDFLGFQGKELDPKRYAWLNHLVGAGQCG